MSVQGQHGEDAQGYIPWYKRSRLQVVHRSIQRRGQRIQTNMFAIPPTITGSQQVAQPLHLMITSSAVVFAERNASLATRVSPSSTSQP